MQIYTTERTNIQRNLVFKKWMSSSLSVSVHNEKYLFNHQINSKRTRKSAGFIHRVSHGIRTHDSLSFNSFTNIYIYVYIFTIYDFFSAAKYLKRKLKTLYGTLRRVEIKCRYKKKFYYNFSGKSELGTEYFITNQISLCLAPPHVHFSILKYWEQPVSSTLNNKKSHNLTSIITLNFWDETWKFLLLILFGLLFSYSLLYSQHFGWCFLHPFSVVSSRTRGPVENIEPNP